MWIGLPRWYCETIDLYRLRDHSPLVPICIPIPNRKVSKSTKQIICDWRNYSPQPQLESQVTPGPHGNLRSSVADLGSSFFWGGGANLICVWVNEIFAPKREKICDTFLIVFQGWFEISPTYMFCLFTFPFFSLFSFSFPLFPLFYLFLPAFGGRSPPSPPPQIRHCRSPIESLNQHPSYVQIVHMCCCRIVAWHTSAWICD